MKKVTYGFTGIFLMLLCFNNVLKANEHSYLTQALDKLVNNFNQYEIVLVSRDKGQEQSDILYASYQENGGIVIDFMYRQERAKFILNQFDDKNARADGSYRIASPFGFYNVRVELTFNADGTANGYWIHQEVKNEFNIGKKQSALTQALDKLINHSQQYKIFLVSIDKGQEYCEIVGVYRAGTDIIIKFKYRELTRLTLDDFDHYHSIARGTYPLKYFLGTTTVKVRLEFNADGTAKGKWKNKGFEDNFNIVKQK